MMKTEVISAPDRDLLRACLLDGEAARAAFSAWRPHGRRETMESRTLRMMPLLYGNLSRLRVEDPMMPWLKGLAKHIWLTGSVRLRRIMQVLAAFDTAGIGYVLIKGAALLARWPAQMNLRPMGDFDVLVAPAQIRPALAILRAQGWNAPDPGLMTAGDLRRGHALGVAAGPSIWIDLHWHPSAAIKDPDYAAAVRARAAAAVLSGQAGWVAGLTDHLFILLAHAFYNAGERRFDWIMEACLLLRLGEAGVDWALFHALARRYHLDAWMRLALREIDATLDGALPRAALPGGLHFGHVGQKMEIFARDARPPRSLKNLVCAFGDARRAGGGGVATDPAMLARLSRAPVARWLLAPRWLLRLATFGRLPVAGLGAIGPDGFEVTRDDAGTSLVAGWSDPEGGGRWSDGDVAWLLLRAPGWRPGPVMVHVAASSLPMDLVPVLPFLEADISAGGARRLVRFDGPPGGVSLPGRVRRWRGQSVLPVAVVFRSPVDSAARGLQTQDKRRFGLFLTRVSLQTL